MISFFVSFYRLIKIIVLGIKNDKDFKFLCFFILILLVGATVFYTTMEGWSVVDSIYFAVMTMSTVGYGDIVPTTDISKIFTIIYTFLSIGSFVAFTAKTVGIVVEDHHQKQEQKRLRKEKKEQEK
ncbi:hypothetical protein CSB11_00835 [Candidatus Campbellbacteria bacterium]|nr:MAG: hypothetical protein CSB11_00835 [Candidatus Campbellbacteria bacterium]